MKSGGLSRALIMCVTIAGVNAARGDHGPGTSGGGAATQSGETLKPGKFAIEFREDCTEFENLSDGRPKPRGREVLICWTEVF